jgi:MFS family permease
MSLEPPTRARYVTALWLCGLAFVLYLDRVCMSQAAIPITEELRIDNAEFSYAAMAFTLAYGLFAVPFGRLGDRFGPRLVLALIVFVWSLFTAGTGLATSLAMLIVVRFLFGMSEAGAYPNAARVIAHWFPISERGRVQGLMLSFGQFGGIAAPFLSGLVIQAFNWRVMFFSYALLGGVWALGFWFWYRNDPARHTRVNELELASIRSGSTGTAAVNPGPVPWHSILTNYGVIVLGALQVFSSFFTYFFYTWTPMYFKKARGAEDLEAGSLNSLIIAGSAVGMLIGGWLADRITRTSVDPPRSRRRLCVSMYLLAAACMFTGTRCDTALQTALLWCAAMAFMHVQLPNWWSVVIPQGGRHVATVFAITNGVGVMGALASQGFVGIVSDYREKKLGYTGREAWDPLFDVYVLVLVAAAVMWWLYKFTPIEEPQPES